MNKMKFSLKTAVLMCLLSVCAFPQKTADSLWAQRSDMLQRIVDDAVAATLAEYKGKGVEASHVAATAVDLRDPAKPAYASFRGADLIYPASVVKMFYMAALHQWEKEGRVKIEGEVARGLSDMITVSSNDATGYILDVLTGTGSGGELPEKEFAEWAYKRNAVNRYYASMGYGKINVNQKTFCEDAYGIEQQFRNYKGENRNMLTTESAARLMTEIATGRSVSSERSAAMMKLMERDWQKPAANPDEKEFISYALEPGMKLWSKEGWTSRTRHDAAYIETPDGRKVVIVVFTENFAKEPGIIPGIARRILDGVKAL